jgi:hypothetical protein
VIAYRPSKRDVGFTLLILVMAYAIWQGQTAKDVAFRRADHSACIRIERIKGVIRVQLQRAFKTLPAISYYKTHPDELADQLARAGQQLREFAPVKC